MEGKSNTDFHDTLRSPCLPSQRRSSFSSSSSTITVPMEITGPYSFPRMTSPHNEYLTFVPKVPLSISNTTPSSTNNNNNTIMNATSNATTIVPTSAGHLSQSPAICSSFMDFQHTESISCLTILQRKECYYLCVGTLDNCIIVWELNEFTYWTKLTGHKRSIAVLQSIAEEELLLSASLDRTLRLWKMKETTFECIQLIDQFESNILCIYAIENQVILGLQDTTMIIYEFEKKKENNISVGKEDKEYEVEMEVLLLSEENKKQIRAHDGYVYSLAHYSSSRNEQKYLLTGGSDNVIMVWEMNDMKACKTLTGHRAAVLDIHVAGFIYSASMDRTIRCWDPDTFSCRGAMKGHIGPVTCICSVNQTNDEKLCSGSVDGTIRVWDCTSLYCLQILSAHTNSITQLCCNGVFLFSTSLDHRARLWDIDSLFETRGSTSRSDYILDLNSTEDGRWPSMLLDAPIASTLSITTMKLNNHRSLTTSSDATLIHFLRRFLMIQSVSRDPSKTSDCWMAAKFLKALIRQLGATSRLAYCGPDINPVVLGRLGNDPLKPTVLFYGHYDVQPAHIEDGWDTPPFALTGKNGYLYGRGASDDKGPILTCLLAIVELLSRNEKAGKSKMDGLPNLLFLYQGEGENNSNGLQDAVAENLDVFKQADLVVVSNNYWLGDTIPCLTYGMRGSMRIRIEISGAKADVHSGVDGGIIREPIHDLLVLINKIIDPKTGECTSKEFYADVTELSEEEDNLFKRVTFDIEEYKRSLGVRELLPEILRKKENDASNGDNKEQEEQLKQEILTRRWRYPSISITNIKTSLENDSIIPHKAFAVLNIRTVPNQNIKTLETLLENHIREKFKEIETMNDVNVIIESNIPWWLGDIHNRYYKAAECAVRQHWKMPPMFVRGGGTSQNIRYLEETLEAACLLLPMGQASDRAHLQNERIRLRNLRMGKEVVMDFLLRVGNMPRA